MTEEEWLRSIAPTNMLAYIRSWSSDRKLRLYTCAAARHLWSDDADTFRRREWEQIEHAIDFGIELDKCRGVGEVVAELPGTYYGRPTPDAPPFVMIGSIIVPVSVVAYLVAMNIVNEMHSMNFGVVIEVVLSSGAFADYADPLIRFIPLPAAEDEDYPLEELPALFRDIFGNPFRPVAFDPNWRTSDVAAMARGMYETRDFAAMPILADALQDAGCENDDVLAHCRGLGPHVRGCWVVDLILGKE